MPSRNVSAGPTPAHAGDALDSTNVSSIGQSIRIWDAFLHRGFRSIRDPGHRIPAVVVLAAVPALFVAQILDLLHPTGHPPIEIPQSAAVDPHGPKGALVRAVGAAVVYVSRPAIVPLERPVPIAAVVSVPIRAVGTMETIVFTVMEVVGLTVASASIEAVGSMEAIVSVTMEAVGLTVVSVLRITVLERSIVQNANR